MRELQWFHDTSVYSSNIKQDQKTGYVLYFLDLGARSGWVRVNHVAKLQLRFECTLEWSLFVSNLSALCALNVRDPLVFICVCIKVSSKICIFLYSHHKYIIQFLFIVRHHKQWGNTSWVYIVGEIKVLKKFQHITLTSWSWSCYLERVQWTFHISHLMGYNTKL